MMYLWPEYMIAQIHVSQDNHEECQKKIYISFHFCLQFSAMAEIQQEGILRIMQTQICIYSK